jgi:hypothetical protein
MVTTAGATPVTTPVVETTIAIAVLLLLHVPPEVASVRVMGAPLTETLDGPLMDAGAEGSATTLTNIVALHPLARV